MFRRGDETFSSQTELANILMEKISSSLKDGLVWACFFGFSFLKVQVLKVEVEVQLPELIQPGNFCCFADSHQLGNGGNGPGQVLPLVSAPAMMGDCHIHIF